MMKKFLFGLIGTIVGFSAFTIYAQENPYIAYNEGSGLITVYSTDFSYGITIQDKNLGAENVGDTGYYYQWGNNNGKTQSSSITNVGLVWQDSYDNHGYDGDVMDFVMGQGNNMDIWAGDTRHDNVRGGGNDNDTSDANIIRGYDTVTHQVTNLTGRQGPCSVGYHVPSVGERRELIKLYYESIGNTGIFQEIDACDAYDWDCRENLNFLESSEFLEKMELPLVGSINAPYFFPSVNMYISSSPKDYYDYYGIGVGSIGNDMSFGATDRIVATALRCFKNDYEAPNLYTIDFNSNGGENLSGISVLSGNYIELPGTTKDYYTFSGWYTEMNSGDFIGESGTTYTASGDVTLYAHWTPIEYTITYELDGGTNNENNTGKYTIETPDIALENPTKDGYNFEGWFSDAEFTTGVTTIPTGTTGNITLYAKWTPVEYAITYELDGGTNSENNVTGYTIETPDITLENATKDGYNFSGWFTDAEFTTGVTTIPTGTTGDITLYAKWTKIETKPSGGSSGGGSRSNKTSDMQISPDPSLSRGEQDNSSFPLDKGDTALAEGIGEGGGETVEGFSDEFQQAYEFAHEKGITTMDTIQEANMNGKLTRIAMAKMLSQYAINVLGQKPANIVVPNFNDITEKLDADYDNGVTLAYQLGIMGINMPDNKFRPNDEVTRGEFATALSRMLYNTSDGEYKSTPKYYIYHMEKLVKEGIITKDDPAMKELRGYVMIMLMRSAK